MTHRKRAIALNSKDYALLAAEAASDKKAEDIVVIDVAELLVVTDYFVICTAGNDRLVRTIGDEVEFRLKAAGLPAIGIEGREEGKWLLLDFADVVVHVFQPAERGFYRLERLWGEAESLKLPESITGPVAKPAEAPEPADAEEPGSADAEE